ncbi:hypothetical protein [Sphingomonas aerophila]|uniref:Uncharacterized protein n=1 Tax=Sphingomonas aerophila TaxID=1344948 RepID=A0A7W9BDU2_9SPHN|nr:hypothetical protein [Sphingomonas aerophila]MBB5715420.1 hypothetical protein [Sphingomonas aerophila]
MAFPLSITGQLRIRHQDLNASQDARDRLRDALHAQTVDTITIGEDTIQFTPQVKGGERKLRPEGEGWMFNALGVCSLRLDRTFEGLTVSYKLDCRVWFWLSTAFSLAAGLVIRFTRAPDYQWAWALALGFWLVFFMFGYVSKTIEFRRWLRNNLTSVELPRTKRLEVPIDLE